MRGTLALTLVLFLLAGCLRVGPGEDLHLVCEEKSASPRKAYGIETMVAQTRIETSPPLAQERTLAMLEAARQHIVTPRGMPHAGFTGTLRNATAEGDAASDGWLFHAVGVWEDEPQDDYFVRLLPRNGSIESGPLEGPGPVQPPRTLVDAAWASVNASPDIAARAGAQPAIEWAAWDPAAPSCVRLRLAGAEGAIEVTTNIVQGRIVDLG